MAENTSILLGLTDSAADTLDSIMGPVPLPSYEPFFHRGLEYAFRLLYADDTSFGRDTPPLIDLAIAHSPSDLMPPSGERIFSVTVTLTPREMSMLERVANHILKPRGVALSYAAYAYAHSRVTYEGTGDALFDALDIPEQHHVRLRQLLTEPVTTYDGR